VPCLPRNEPRANAAAIVVDIKGRGPAFDAIWVGRLFRHFEQPDDRLGYAPGTYTLADVDP